MTRAVLMAKGDLLGAVGVSALAGLEFVRTYDSRCGVKTGARAQVVVTAGYSGRIVGPEVEESVRRGWRVFYDGPPLKS